MAIRRLGLAALCLLAAPAAAQEATVRTVGIFTGGVGYVDVDAENARAVNDRGADTAVNEVALIRDAEVHFRFQLVADNGLTFGIRTELETGDGGDTTDENFATVSGDFGRIEIGEADGAADAFAGLSMVDYSFSSVVDASGLLFDYYADEAGFEFEVVGADTSDDLKISYYTPKIAGFSAGVSYVPAVREGADDVNQSDLTNETNAFELGAGYSDEFSEVGVDIGVAWTSDTAARVDDDDAYDIGVKFSFAGFQVGGDYVWQNENVPSSDGEERDFYGLAVAYGTGPWLASLSFAQVLSGVDEDTFGITADLGYTLAPGVTVGGAIEYGSADGTDDSGRNEIDDSFAIGTFIGLNF